MKNPIGWFEIPVKDFDRAVQFYEKVFDVTLNVLTEPKKMAFFPQDAEAHGSSGALVEETEGFKVREDGIMLYFTAPDINATLGKIEEFEGKKLMERTSIGAFGFVGYFKDCEGNRLALHSRE